MGLQRLYEQCKHTDREIHYKFKLKNMHNVTRSFENLSKRERVTLNNNCTYKYTLPRLHHEKSAVRKQTKHVSANAIAMLPVCYDLSIASQK